MAPLCPIVQFHHVFVILRHSFTVCQTVGVLGSGRIQSNRPTWPWQYLATTIWGDVWPRSTSSILLYMIVLPPSCLHENCQSYPELLCQNQPCCRAGLSWRSGDRRSCNGLLRSLSPALSCFSIALWWSNIGSRQRGLDRDARDAEVFTQQKNRRRGRSKF